MNKDVCNELLAMKQRDIDMRSRLLDEGKLYGNYAPEMQKVHREIAETLDAIISQHGWPGTSLVGVEGCRAAWMIAQHSICTPSLQRKFLTFLTEASERGDVPKAQVAFLTDRIRFNENRPQVYGTVLDWDENGELGCEIEDREHVDTRRKAVGLGPFLEDLESHRRKVQAEGGKPPVDVKRYKEVAKQWAKSVGWL